MTAKIRYYQDYLERKPFDIYIKVLLNKMFFFFVQNYNFLFNIIFRPNAKKR